MKSGLKKLGATAFTHKWWFISAWAVVLIVLGVLAATFYKEPSNEIRIPGTEAQQTLDRYAELFPDEGRATARVVFEARNNTEIGDHEGSVEAVLRDIQDIDGVSQVTSPLEFDEAVSDDGTIAFATIGLEEEIDSIDSATVAGVEEAVRDARTDNLAVEMGGDIIDQTPDEILGIGEVVGVLLALVVLLFALRSFVAAGLPIVAAIVAVGAGAGGLFALSDVIEITFTTPILAIMLGLAVGIDYALFIVNKYRHYLLKGYSYKDATALAIGTAGHAIVFAAITAIVALSALAIVGIPFITSMGLAAAATITIASIIAITLLPALFGMVGSKIFYGKTKKAIIAAQKRGPKSAHKVNRKPIWNTVGEFVVKRPVLVLVSSLVIITVVALPAASLNLGLPTDEIAAEDTTQRKAYDTIARGFGAGANSPLLIVAEDVQPVSDEDRQEVREELEAIFDEQITAETARQTQVFEQRAANVSTPEEVARLQQDIAAAEAEAAEQERAARAELESQIEQYSDLYQLNRIAENIAELDSVDQALPAMVTDDTTKGVIQVIPTTGPSNQETIDLISYLREDENVQRLSDSSQTTFGVTGSTALQVDIERQLAAALPTYLAVVMVILFLILIVVFRSILVPLKAVLGLLLSILAMFGALVAVFQWGWFGITDAPGPIISLLPVIAIGVLLSLAIDYEFFVVSSIQEEYERTDNAMQSIIDGYSVAGRVVVAAGVIMVAVFAGFVGNPDETIQAIGLALAVGIFIDAFIVRLLIVPAVLALLGKAAWWLPKPLARLLPKVSIE